MKRALRLRFRIYLRRYEAEEEAARTGKSMEVGITNDRLGSAERQSDCAAQSTSGLGSGIDVVGAEAE
jgi:hypothetical protein